MQNTAATARKINAIPAETSTLTYTHFKRTRYKKGCRLGLPSFWIPAFKQKS